MDIREKIKDAIVNYIVETKVGSRPSSQVPDTREPVANEGKPAKAGPRAGTKWYGKRVERMIKVNKAKGKPLDNED
jgi:hypothetical protein